MGGYSSISTCGNVGNLFSIFPRVVIRLYLHRRGYNINLIISTLYEIFLKRGVDFFPDLWYYISVGRKSLQIETFKYYKGAVNMLKKVKAGYYVTTDGKIAVEKDGGFWYAYDIKTGQSVVDCERTLSEIKLSLSGYFEREKGLSCTIKKYDSVDILIRLECEDGYVCQDHEICYGYETDFDWLISEHGNITHVFVCADPVNGDCND